ncbi:Bacterial membrane flanked domain protein [Poriferisphaera corsica]|uniref:Bacterial membrane flanked domain protein n=1 Tax=Poriferisphaera corsica TaxID=2528020 RepID=A0A517YW94_9BACT|nr:PH domain-containing protein [Poriferisphaera corsica]QDU34501.1 Bacterial membrane flanked domain protein [Poriferisphaera corsica]
MFLTSTTQSPSPKTLRRKRIPIHPKHPPSPTKLDYADDGITPDIETNIRPGVMIPHDILQPGEAIILLLKPSLLYIVLAPLRAIAILAFLTLATLVANNMYTFTNPREIIFIGGVAIAARIFWQFVEWLSRTYILTDQRLIRIKGVTTVSVYETPLSNIQQTEVIRSIREQLTALGTIAFSTAGTGHIDAYWVMLNNPYEIQNTIIKTINRYHPRNKRNP